MAMEVLLKIAKAMAIEKPPKDLIDAGLGEEALHSLIRVELEERFLIEYDEVDEGWMDRLAILYAGEPVEFMVEELVGAALWEGNMEDVLAKMKGAKGDVMEAVLREIGMEGKFERIAVVEKPVRYDVWLAPEVSG